MGFNPPVPQQDSNWEIRVALLLSLLLQVVLIFLGPMRKRSASLISRFIIWSCYLLADWVADLGLGLILNNMGNIGGGGGDSTSSFFGLKRGGGGSGTASTAGNNNSSNDTSSGSGSPIIFAFWTPFLLLHLGGPDTITSYSLEDNELWLRHLIGLLFELFSACVIFFCSLRGNPLIHATVLMFVAGVVKYAERTYSLYCGSLERFRANILGPPDPGRNYVRFMTELDSKEKAGLDVEIVIPNNENGLDEEAKSMAVAEVTSMVVATQRKGKEAQAYYFFGIFRRLFVDLVLSSKQRRMAQAFFVERKAVEAFETMELEFVEAFVEAFETMELELGFVYDMVYTKGGPVAHTSEGCVLRSVCSVCLVSALVIFFRLDKDKHMMSRVDVSITYALLLGGLALDLVALAMLLLSDRAAVFLQKSRWRRRLFFRWLRWLAVVARRWWQARHWSWAVAQLNLIGYCTVGNGYYGWKGLMVSKLSVIFHDLVFIRYQSLGKISYYTKTVEEVGGGSREEVVQKKDAHLPFPFCFIRRKGISRSTVGESFILEMFFRGVADLKQEAEMLKAKGKWDIMEMFNCRGNRVIQRHATYIKKAIENNDEAKHLAMDKIKKSLEEKDEAKRLSMDDIDKIKAEVAKEKFRLILDSVEQSDFDESLLLWHIATDLCGLQDRRTAPTADEERLRPIGETLSEYMLYLLVKQPEMLSARTGIWLMRYRDTCEEARRLFSSMEAWIDDHDDARKMLLSVNTSEKPPVVKGDDSKSVLFDAVILAKELRKLDDWLMWEVVSGVWTEMLLYAARSCPGSTHVRHLNRGGELITIIWFLMEHMGLGNAHDVKKVDVPAKLIVHK